jgi:hypothetical protein
MLAKELDLPCQSLRLAELVSVESTEKASSTLRESAVVLLWKRGAVRIHDVAKPWILESGQHLPAGHRGGILHDDQLELGQRLGEHALDRRS